MSTKSYRGSLLVSNPNNPQDSLHQSVILLLAHTNKAAIGIQINHAISAVSLRTLAATIGLDYQGTESLWYGGNVDRNKIHVVHSNEWSGLSTIKINDEISVTNDISILVAISQGIGPEYYRACAGYWIWDQGLLDVQLSNSSEPESRHRWEIAPTTIDSVFEDEGITQWINTLEDSAQEQIDSWF